MHDSREDSLPFWFFIKKNGDQSKPQAGDALGIVKASRPGHNLSCRGHANCIGTFRLASNEAKDLWHELIGPRSTAFLVHRAHGG